MSSKALMKTGIVLTAAGLIGGMVWNAAFMMGTFNSVASGVEPDAGVMAKNVQSALIGTVGGASIAIIGVACIFWGLVSRRATNDEGIRKP